MKIKQILVAFLIIYALLYLGLFIVPFMGSDQPLDLEGKTVLIAFSIYALGLLVTFFNQKFGSIILMIWHLVIWIFAMGFWPDSGMTLVMSFPILLVSAFLLQNWYKMRATDPGGAGHQTRLVLRILLINYAVIYLGAVIFNTLPALGIDFFMGVHEPMMFNPLSVMGIMLWVAFAIFVAGFISSWKNERRAGILFLVWYGMILVVTVAFAEFRNSGPWAFFGATILVNAIFYLYSKDLQDSKLSTVTE